MNGPNIYKVLDEIDSKSILEFYDSIESKIVWNDFGPKGKQSGIQYKTGECQFLSATDRARYPDHYCDNINDLYKNTIIEEIIKKYNLYRTRWMWIHTFSCYSIHRDNSNRVHIPLITNPGCLFLFPPDKTFHLEIDKVYHVSTTVPHTFLNASTASRLHLVGSVLT